MMMAVNAKEFDVVASWAVDRLVRKIDPDAILPAATLSGIRERALQQT
jgi:hypothetical protein